MVRRWLLAGRTAVGTVVATLAVAGLLAAPAEAATEFERLRAGEVMTAGDRLVSPSGRFRLELGADGVLQLTERASWLTGEETDWVGYAGVRRFTLQTDGNLVAYGDAGTVRADFGTRGTGASELRLLDDRSLRLYDQAGATVLDVPTGPRGRLVEGGTLLPGDILPGADLTYLQMQTDGNLVLRAGAAPSNPVVLWSSRTDGNPGAGAIMQDDGNLVVYSSAATGRRPLFHTSTYGAAAHELPSLVVEDTELSVRVAADDTAEISLWGSNWGSDRVASGDELDWGDRRVSPGGRCTLVMQSDHNLVQYCGGRAVFSTGRPGPWLRGEPFERSTTRVQLDGNVVTYQETAILGEPPRVLFTTATRGSGGGLLVVQDDGNLVLRRSDGTPVWSHVTGRL